VTWQPSFWGGWGDGCNDCKTKVSCCGLAKSSCTRWSQLGSSLGWTMSVGWTPEPYFQRQSRLECRREGWACSGQLLSSPWADDEAPPRPLLSSIDPQPFSRCATGCVANNSQVHTRTFLFGAPWPWIICGARPSGSFSKWLNSVLSSRSTHSHLH
jgi:hypothetical protein